MHGIIPCERARTPSALFYIFVFFRENENTKKEIQQKCISITYRQWLGLFRHSDEHRSRPESRLYFSSEFQFETSTSLLRGPFQFICCARCYIVIVSDRDQNRRSSSIALYLWRFIESICYRYDNQRWKKIQIIRFDWTVPKYWRIPSNFILDNAIFNSVLLFTNSARRG